MAQRQVMFANFPADVAAKELAAFLEESVGVVWRCKLKRTSIPAHAFMCFVSRKVWHDAKRERLGRCCPHAFVHFASSEVAKEAVALASKTYLLFRGHALIARMAGGEVSCRVSRIRSEEQKAMRVEGNMMVEVGSQLSPLEFSVDWKIPGCGIKFEVDPFDKRVRFFWSQDTVVSSGRDGNGSVRCNYKMEFLMRDVRQVRQIACASEGGRSVPAFSMLLHFWVPPWIFYRTDDDDIHETRSFVLEDDDDPWIRTLDSTPNNSIGRCLTYRVGVTARHRTAFNRIIGYFRMQCILHRDEVVHMAVSVPSRLKLSYISPGPYFYSVNGQSKNVSFENLFLVNALVHRGIIQPETLQGYFFELLEPKLTSPAVVSLALQSMLASKKPVYDASKRLKQAIKCISDQQKLGKAGRRPPANMIVRRVVITPTRGYCLAPEVELSNRVVRHYSSLADHFLRVSFQDDDLQPITSNAMTVSVAPIVRDVCKQGALTRTALYWRIRDILESGFELCGRRYNFLAFSQSQLRESSAWFFASEKRIKPESIRSWMGEFQMQNVAKVAARMGQCFSATYPTMEVQPHEVNDLADVKRNGYIFSDGVGKISPDFALEISKTLLLEQAPSAFQIRYAGYKGVIVQWPGSQHKLELRKSMKKFSSGHTILEVVGWTRFYPAYLNRQIVTLLSSLGVRNQVFIDLQATMVEQLCKILTDADLALQHLQTTCSGELHNTAVTMLSGGFHPSTEPHLKGMLRSIRCMQLGELLARAKIFVPNGRWLMGCLDELGQLQYGQCFVQVSVPPSKDGGPSQRVIVGKVIMTKNPCLHPGDIRVLEAVDVQGLHHLVDCLVVPQNGDRPHPNEASGSDLDGDIYFVSWDPCLLPPGGKSFEPMNYAVQGATDIGREVAIEDIHEFFAKHAVNDSLGVICNAHVVHADRHAEGALHESCLKLANLAATAVDYPKTGVTAVMPHELRPSEYPDFMEKENLRTYTSEKVLGILYRLVKQSVAEEIASQEKWNADEREILLNAQSTYDPDLEVPGYELYLEDAWACKCRYDQHLWELMTRYDIKWEGDIATGHLLYTGNSRQQGDMKDRVRYAYGSLRKEFRIIFEGRITSENEVAAIQESQRHGSVNVTTIPLHSSLTEEGSGFTSMKESFRARLKEFRTDDQSLIRKGQTLVEDEKLDTSQAASVTSANSISDKGVSVVDKLAQNGLVDDKIMLQAKASAWYQVTYHPTWMEQTRGLKNFNPGGQGYLLSFPWIAADVLAEVKARKVNHRGKVIVKQGKLSGSRRGESFLDKLCQ